MRNKVHIDDNYIVQNNLSLYKNITLEEGVFCGPSIVFTDVYNLRSLIKCKAEYRDTCVGERGATKGVNFTVVCGVHIGELTYSGLNTLLKIADYGLFVLSKPIWFPKINSK